METFYLVIVIILFLLAVSDLVVGVSNDAVNFLNSAVGSKAATLRTVMIVAALGIIFGCTFSSGMMEVARKGIFHPEYFSFSEIMLVFLAVMVTDVILLDAFNTFGMPTSTTVSIVFELLGAAVALSLIKVYTDPNALELASYINSGKALAIIAGILLSVVVAFSAGVLVQYPTRLLFSFDYERRLKYFGALWGGISIAAITYFILVKGAKGASFMDDSMQAAIKDNGLMIILVSFAGWSLILQLLIWFTKVDIFKLIVLVGTFALAMAFASNDLVNFIGVPLAGYNSYEIYQQTGGGDPDGFLMEGLAGRVPTPTLLLLLAGVIMTITLWTSKKARSVIKTSLDLGRQYEGAERFDSYAISRSLVRNFSKMATAINDRLPNRWKSYVDKQFDEKPFVRKQEQYTSEPPVIDMLRAAVTLVVASIVISIGTAMKLPLSTTYVTFMVFMGASLADGAWGRESAVYRVSGVLSVIGGWFFTALSAFTVAFLIAALFYFGGALAIAAVLIIAGMFMYRTHRYHGQRVEEQNEFEKIVVETVLTREQVIQLTAGHLSYVLGGIGVALEDTLKALADQDLDKLKATHRKLKALHKKAAVIKSKANRALDKIEDDEIEAGHLYILVVDYLSGMAAYTMNIVKPSYIHVDNHHKPLMSEQIKELRGIVKKLEQYMQDIQQLFTSTNGKRIEKLLEDMDPLMDAIRDVRKKQIKRIRNHEIGTRNSILFLNHLAELRNLALFSNRLARVYNELIVNADENPTAGEKPAKN